MYRGIQKIKKSVPKRQITQALTLLILGSAGALLTGCPLAGVDVSNVAEKAARAIRVDEEIALEKKAMRAKYHAVRQKDRADDLERDLEMERKIQNIRNRGNAPRRPVKKSCPWYTLGLCSK